MEIKINGSPEEIAKLLQVTETDLEQKIIKIICNPTDAFSEELADTVNRENNKKMRVTSIDAMTLGRISGEVLSKNDPSKFPRSNLTN